MANSQNGWTVLDSPPKGGSPFITGRVRSGDVDVIFDWFNEQFHNKVEHIRTDWSWGWAKRNVRGSTSVISNHASATAEDLNAPAHPLGKRNTFSPKQVTALRSILRSLEGVLRWGGDYQNRADEMHFEINANAAAVKRIADKIRKGEIGGRIDPWKWNPEAVSDLAPVQIQFQIAQGMRKGKVQRYHGVAAIQRALNVKFLGKGEQLPEDGYVGPKTLAAWKAYESKAGGTGSKGTPDPTSLKALQIAYRFKGPQAPAPK